MKQFTAYDLYQRKSELVNYPEHIYDSADENARAIFGISRVGSDMFELTMHADRVRVFGETILYVR